MDEDIQGLLRRKRYRHAFECLLDRYQVRTFRMAIMFLRDRGRAEEVTQEIFLTLWRVLPSYDDRAALSTWLYTIARNTCLSALRSETYRRTVSFDSIAEPVVETGGGDLLRKVELDRCLERLSEVQREVVLLFYLQDKDVQEVARMLDLPEGTVKSHLSRARIALAGMMKE
jgi:RNA polymerase sigma-70 factor (ECF subfamily)